MRGDDQGTFFLPEANRACAGVEPAPNTVKEHCIVFAVRAFGGASGRLRTCMARFKGPVLCQLSYECAVMAPAGFKPANPGLKALCLQPLDEGVMVAV